MKNLNTINFERNNFDKSTYIHQCVDLIYRRLKFSHCRANSSLQSLMTNENYITSNSELSHNVAQTKE